MNYTHLTQDERYQIAILLKAGHDQSDIARLMNRHKSTISRELARNRGQRGYRPRQAHQLAVARMRATANARRVDPATWAFAQAKLTEQWSPEQISGFLKVQGLPGVSHETLYQRIYADKRAGGALWWHLRCQKLRRKRYGRHDRRGSIPGRISIESRPPAVEARIRVGHWEGDTIIGANHRQALVSLVERKSRYTLLTKVERKTAELVGKAVTGLLKPFKARVHSLTTDNGKEFAGHQSIAQQLDAAFYFAHPYASWERGTNENTNGLVRQYFPKKRRFDTIDHKEVRLAMDRLNHRPRKCLGFRTPHEVFMQSLRRVALQD
jgi:IS30 family transposase